MGKKITQYPNNVSTNPDDLSLLDLSEKTGTSTFESRKWNLTAFKAWVNSWVVAGTIAWNDITGKPTLPTGSGSANYLAKWSTANNLTNSFLECDANGRFGIGGIMPEITFAIESPDTAVLNLYNTSSNPATYGLMITSGSGVNNFGVYSIANGGVTGKNVAIYGNASSATTNIGIHAVASGGTSRYSAQLQDGTEGAGKFLKSIDSVGRANWATITASDISGVVGAVGGTNNYVAKFTPDGNTIGNSLIFDNGTNVGVGIGSPTEKLHVNGNMIADNYYINNVPYAIMPYRYKKNVASISNSGYTTLCNVTGTSLGSGVRLSIMGTTAGTVVSVVADILTSYLQDIYIESKAGIYSILTLKVISDDAENFTIQATTNSPNVLTAEVEVYPLSSESIVFDPSTIYTGATLTHQCVSGFSISATGGTSLQNGNITTMGNITGSNLSGTNTGDQDLSGLATKNITLDRKTASYTLVAGDNNKLIEMNVGSANNVTINNSVFSAGNQILVSQYGAGQVTFVAGAGVTLRSPSGKLKLTGQYSLATIIAISATEFYISGDLTA
jgi:hypothetical protein